MPKVNLFFPVDPTFLSSLIYEGLLYLIQDAKNFSVKEIEFGNDFLSKAYKDLDDNVINNLTIATTGINDDQSVRRLLGRLNIDSNLPVNVYSSLLKIIKEKSDSINVTRDLCLNFEITKGETLIDLKKGSPKDQKITLQILKVDRYTGLTSLETPYTSARLTLYTSPEVTLIALLGIYSSFVQGLFVQRQQYYYFLFLSPDEVLKALSVRNKDLVKAYLGIKNSVRKIIASVIKNYASNELLITEMALNLEIRELIKEENLDKISLLLFKIAREGRTYKIYETVPITIFKETSLEILMARNFRNPDRLVKCLLKAISPEGIILNVLSTINKQVRYIEVENILGAINGLYRFVVLGDAQGFYEFNKKIFEAIRKLENSKDQRERERYKKYCEIVRGLSFA